MNRAQLKLDCLAILDARASEHPAGHQGKLAARYLLRCASGAVELMFEKAPATPANLWGALSDIANLIPKSSFDSKIFPASALYSTKGKNGDPLYGRHSALKVMSKLQNADLVRFRLSTVAELNQILDHFDP